VQTLLPIIAISILLALLSRQYLRTPNRNADGTGYVLMYPRVMMVGASAGVLLVLFFTASMIYALVESEVSMAMIYGGFAVPFGLLGYFSLRKALTRITIDDSGIEQFAWSKYVRILWTEATIDAVTMSQCVIITNVASQEIRVYESMIGARIIEDYVRKYVSPGRIRFIRNISGEHQLFYREPSR
jgi:hypothetical protein